MHDPSADARQIKAIKAEEARLRSHIREIAEQRKRFETNLYRYMNENHIETFEGITIRSIAPKEKVKRIPIKKKKQDAVKLLRDVGIPDPQTFWTELQKTQTSKSAKK